VFVSHIASGSSAAVSDPEPADSALVTLALVIAVGVIAAIFDLTIVNVAITTLQHALHTDIASIGWVSTGYALAASVTIPISGWVFERLGGRHAWLLALLIFGTASVLCAIAWSVPSLIVFRIIQGVGGGLLLPLAQTILVTAAGQERVGRIVPYIAIPSQLGPVLGPVIGGVILHTASWRFLFLINVPLIAAACVLSWRTVPDTGRARTRQLDVLGLVLLSPALALLVYGFTRAAVAGTFGQPSVIIPFVAGAVLLIGYGTHALRPHADPPLNLRYLKARGYATSSALMFGSGITLFGALFLLPLYYQQFGGVSPLQAGLLLAPQGVGVAIGTILGGRLIERMKLGHRIPALIGLTILIITTVPFLFAQPSADQILLASAVALRGIGLGLTLVPLTSALYVGLPRAAIPSATTGVRIFQQIGGALGTAVLAVILQHAMSHGTAAAFRITFIWVLAFTALSYLPALFLPGTTAAGSAKEH